MNFTFSTSHSFYIPLKNVCKEVVSVPWILWAIPVASELGSLACNWKLCPTWWVMWADCGTHEVYATATKFYVNSIFSYFWNSQTFFIFYLSLKKYVNTKMVQRLDAMVKDYHVTSVAVLHQTARWILFNLVIIIFPTLT